jgi:hypothetical protein
MRLDIRVPLGLLFLVFGLLLSAFGLTSDKGIYERSLYVNINFWWGLMLLLFGAMMLAFGRRGHRRLAGSEESAGSAAEGASGRK